MKHVMSIGIHWAQARRITCEHCGQPYVFVDGGCERAESEESVAFSDEAELRRTAFREAANAVDEAAERKEQGRGRCPHCHQLQEWMRIRPTLAIGGLFVLTAAATALAGYIASAWISDAATWPIVAAVAVVGAVASVFGGRRIADPPGAQMVSDPLAKTDEQFAELLEESGPLGEDPILRWWKGTGGALILNKKNLIEVSMGLWDQTSNPFPIAEELTTKACSARLNRLDA